MIAPALWSEIPSLTLGTRAFVRGRLRVIISIDRAADRTHWIHVSLSHRDRIPIYEELAKAKELFIGPEREAIQVFPAADKHVNDHPHCLHLWSRLDGPVMPDLRRYEPLRGKLSI